MTSVDHALPHTSTTTTAPSTAGSHQRLTSALREAIVSGEFVPNQRLVEADLCSQFKASRAAVRSALFELAGEGLVERVQNRGSRVRAVTLQEAVEISEVRLLLESLCAAKAAERITPAEIEEFQELRTAIVTAVDHGNVAEYSRLNQELDRRVREISGQQTAVEVLERLRAQSVRHQFRLAQQPGRARVSMQEHCDIIDAIVAHDGAAAEAAARRHMDSVVKALGAASGAAQADHSGGQTAP